MAETIAIVGPCGSGKSSLAQGLAERGYSARQIAQEHSYVPEMWQVITNPDILIYLEASFQACTKRKGFNWKEGEYQEQLKRLQHAHQNCQILIDTTELDRQAVVQAVVEQLNKLGC